MKFQNSSINGFKVMQCIKKRDERTDGRTDGRTNNPEAICPSNFFEVGGIIMHLRMDRQTDFLLIAISPQPISQGIMKFNKRS